MADSRKEQEEIKRGFLEEQEIMQHRYDHVINSRRIIWYQCANLARPLLHQIEIMEAETNAMVDFKIFLEQLTEQMKNKDPLDEPVDKFLKDLHDRTKENNKNKEQETTTSKETQEEVEILVQIDKSTKEVTSKPSTPKRLDNVPKTSTPKVIQTITRPDTPKEVDSSPKPSGSGQRTISPKPKTPRRLSTSSEYSTSSDSTVQDKELFITLSNLSQKRQKDTQLEKTKSSKKKSKLEKENPKKNSAKKKTSPILTPSHKKRKSTAFEFDNDQMSSVSEDSIKVEKFDTIYGPWTRTRDTKTGKFVKQIRPEVTITMTEEKSAHTEDTTTKPQVQQQKEPEKEIKNNKPRIRSIENLKEGQQIIIKDNKLIKNTDEKKNILAEKNKYEETNIIKDEKNNIEIEKNEDNKENIGLDKSNDNKEIIQ